MDQLSSCSSNSFSGVTHSAKEVEEVVTTLDDDMSSKLLNNSQKENLTKLL